MQVNRLGKGSWNMNTTRTARVLRMQYMAFHLQVYTHLT